MDNGRCRPVKFASFVDICIKHGRAYQIRVIIPCSQYGEYKS